MMKNKGTKYAVCVLVNPVTQEKAWVRLDDIKVYVGAMDEEKTKVVGGNPVPLGVLLSSLVERIETLEKDTNTAKLNINDVTRILTNINNNQSILNNKVATLENDVTYLKTK